MPSTTVPMYKLHPAHYMFNKTTKRHVLKKSPDFKKAYTLNPDNYVETSEMFPTAEPAPVATPVPVVLVAMPEAPKPVPAVENNEYNDMISRVRETILAEVKVDPAPYENKGSKDLEVMFRQMLIAKLTKTTQPPHPTINSISKPAPKPAPKPSKKEEPKFNFRIAPRPQESEPEDEFEDDEFEDED